MKQPKNQCALCGKFRKWEDLIHTTGDYSDFTGFFDTWFECVSCMSKAELDRFIKSKQSSVQTFKDSNELL